MLDKIAVMFPGESFPPDKIDNSTFRQNGSYSGYFKGLKINQNIEGCSIRGSIPKYLNGSNVTAMTRHTIKESFEKLAEETGLNINNGQIYKLEIGDTLPVNYPPYNYMQHWGKYGRYTVDRIANGDSVYLRTKSKVFVGYDKGKEIKPGKLPESFGNSYGLRLELRINRGVKKLLGRFPSPLELTERDMFYSLVDLWQKAYFSIPKEPKLCIDPSDMVPNDLKNILAIYGLNQIGLSNIDNFIESSRTAGGIHKRNISRMKSMVRDLLTLQNLTISNELTEEVDSLVRNYS